MASFSVVSIFFRFTARSRPFTRATIPGADRNLIVPASFQRQLPPFHGDGRTATTTTVTVSVSWNLSQSVRSFSTGAVVRAGSVGRHWYNERLASVGLLALIPTGLVYPNPVVDYGLAVLIPLHGHWGLMAVAEDYTPGVLKTPAKGLVYVLTIGAFLGLMYLNVRDIGICGAVRATWSL